MISFVSGKVIEKFLGSVVVDVGGLGYEVQVANLDYDHANPGDEVKFHTYHHVREQSEELYGFSTLTAKRLFELLITVQGVGPKAALSILSLGEGESVRSAKSWVNSCVTSSSDEDYKSVASSPAVCPPCCERGVEGKREERLQTTTTPRCATSSTRSRRPSTPPRPRAASPMRAATRSTTRQGLLPCTRWMSSTSN